MDFGIASVVSACTLCYGIYDRLSCSQGEFKSLSLQALGLHDILKTIESVWRQGSLNEEQRRSLGARIIPLLDLLKTIDARLEKYSSLGTQAPKLSDKINWALVGGAAEVRNELSSQLQGLIAFNTSVLLQQGNNTITIDPVISRSDATISAPSSDLTLLPISEPKPVQSSIKPLSSSKGYSFGNNAIWDGIQFVIFSILTLLVVALIITAGCFYFVGVILFPFAELPFACMRCVKDWKKFNGFFGRLFNTYFRFISGLWD